MKTPSPSRLATLLATALLCLNGTACLAVPVYEHQVSPMQQQQPHHRHQQHCALVSPPTEGVPTQQREDAELLGPSGACNLTDADKDVDEALNDGAEPAKILAQAQEWDAMNRRTVPQADQPIPSVPEPGEAVMLGAGLTLLAWIARRRVSGDKAPPAARR